MGPLAFHHTIDVSGIRYELVTWEHLVAAVLGLGLLVGALRVHRRIGRSPVIAATLGLSALVMGALMILSGRGYLSTRPDVLYALGYGVACACAYLFVQREEDGPGPELEGRPAPPWWPEFERDLRDYLRERDDARSPRRPRPRVPA